MTNAEIEADPSFRRGINLLETRFSDPGPLIAMWRMLPCLERTPWPEKSTPWYKGLENLIK